VVTAVLAVPSLILAAFSGFFFDAPDDEALAWVLATPFLTLPLTVLIAGGGAWVAYARGAHSKAIFLARLPFLHLLAAFGIFFLVAGLSG
jgi:hypothetical protein